MNCEGASFRRMPFKTYRISAIAILNFAVALAKITFIAIIWAIQNVHTFKYGLFYLIMLFLDF